MLDEVLKSGCTAKLKGQTLEVDLANIDLMKVPQLAGIKEILGDPDLTTANRVTYFYELDPSHTAEIVIVRNNSILGMSTVRVTYFRYLFEVDFVRKLAKGKSKDWYNATALGFWVAVSP